MTTDKPNTDATVSSFSYYLSPEKHEVYFSVTLTLSRVGVQTFRFAADRYMARYEDGQRLTDWRTRFYGTMPAGVGEKTMAIVRNEADRLFPLWVASDNFAPEYATAATNYVVRTVRDASRYSLAYGREALAAYREVMLPEDVARISQAINHMESAQNLLAEPAL